MPEHDFQELVGAVVARIVLQDGIAAHVVGLDVIERGHDVPGRAPVAHEVERREHARHVERLVVGRRVGHAEAEPLGRHAHGHHAGDRVHLHAANAVLDGLRVAPAVELGHSEPVVEEGELELAGLEHLADVAIEVGRHEIGAGVGMAPRGGKVGAVLRLQESDQRHLSHVRRVLDRGDAAADSKRRRERAPHSCPDIRSAIPADTMSARSPIVRRSIRH